MNSRLLMRWAGLSMRNGSSGVFMCREHASVISGESCDEYYSYNNTLYLPGAWV